jgi:outer membrane protein OmpA-like peptidoglycan-associated protein
MIRFAGTMATIHLPKTEEGASKVLLKSANSMKPSNHQGAATPATANGMRNPSVSIALRRAASLTVLTLLCLHGNAQSPKLPSELTFLSTWGEVHDRYGYEVWGEATFPSYGPNQVNKTGHHWNLMVDIPGAKDSISAWNIIKPVAIKNGWTVLSVNAEGFLALLRYNRNGVEAWMDLATDESVSPTRILPEVIEVAPPPISLTLAEPGGTPEKMSTSIKGNFPYLAPLPGSLPQGGQFDDSPLLFKPNGSDQDEIVANSSIVRGYIFDNLSSQLFGAVYHDALVKAGWDIEQQSSDGSLIVAHYAKEGRNLWAFLLDGGGTYTIRVGTEGAPDQMKTGLAAACHVALYGVLFDFNKSTLQAASSGPLQQVATLMTANPSLKLEVQGHTDNVGGDAYNKTLSEARAQSVMKWLTDHGVAAGRLTAKGYGKTMPIADNSTDEGRMKNRRVEIADPGCKPHTK